METVKVSGADCINVTVTPIDATADTPVVEAKVEVNDEFLNKFSDEPLTEDPAKAKRKLKNLIKFLKSDKFEDRVNREAYKRGIPPKQVATNAISKAFGIVGDILGIAVDTVNHTLNGLITMLTDILHGTVNMITRAVNALCRILTFNQSAVCA